MSCDVCEFVDVYFNNDHTLLLEDLEVNDSLLNNATVTFQIYDMEDTAVTGATGSLTLNGTGSGDYVATIDKTIIALLTAGEEYRLAVTGSESGNDFEFNLYIRAKRRGST
jgi:hypothetical protein